MAMMTQHKNLSEKRLQRVKVLEVGSSNSNSGTSENHSNHGEKAAQKIEAHTMVPKIHNCVCFVAG